jgi:hypothetical protein
MLRQGLIGAEQLWLGLVFLPALLVGNWLGARGFRGVDPERFRRWILWLLMLLALLTGAKGIVSLADIS